MHPCQQSLSTIYASDWTLYNGGKAALLKHSNGDGHKKIADGLKGRLAGQRSLDQNMNNVGEAEDVPDADPNRDEGAAITDRQQPLALMRIKVVTSVSSQVTIAEILWVLKTVNSNFAFLASQDIVAILRKMDPSSDVFRMMQIKRDKTRYILTHGLYPLYLQKLIIRIKKAPGFTLGTDSSTFKLYGLAKFVDIVIRYWDDEKGQVVDEFFDTNNVGHEPADLQVKHMTDSLANSGIVLSKLICLSRDNPNVMKKVFRLLNNEVKEAGGKVVIDSPCLMLHPTHTAFQKAVKSMKRNLVSLLGNLHGFFKTSTARREDMTKVREDLAERLEDEFIEVLDQFFLRFFMVYLPNSTLQNNKKAIKSKKYKTIAKHLSENKVTKTKMRATFLLLLSSLTKNFLTLLQSEKPMVHKILILAGDMFYSIAKLVVKDVHLLKDYSKIKELDLTQSSIFLNSDEGGYLACCREEVDSLEGGVNRKEIRREMRSAAKKMLSYLQGNIPWDDKLLRQLTFLDPLNRTDLKTVEYGIGAATILQRFSEEEKNKLAVQLSLYQALSKNKVPDHTEAARIDHFWVRVFRALEEVTGERQLELENLVKMCCSLSHGNAFLERGMSITKNIVDGRHSMSDVVVKSTKVVKEVIKRYGGVTEVPITKEVQMAVSKSWSKYNDELKKKEEDLAKAAEETAEEREALRKRKAVEEELNSWKERKMNLEETIKVSQNFIISQERVSKEAMERTMSLKKADEMKISLMAADMARTTIVAEQKKMLKMQQDLVGLVGKKPKKLSDVF